MNIALETIEVWQFEEGFTLLNLFVALPLVTMPDDILVIGSYQPPEYAHDWMAARVIALQEGGSAKPFNEHFEINRDEHPAGRYYALPCSAEVLDGLCQLTRERVLSTEDVFLDHILAYRPGQPILPLMDFHDAFFGGQLWLSGLYSQEVIIKFGTALNAEAKSILNPVMHFAVKENYITNWPWPVDTDK